MPKTFQCHGNAALPVNDYKGAFSVLMQSTAPNIRIALDSRTPSSFARMHFEFLSDLI
jgi:hypothetical protein